eukprot:TRINITY_DN3507_c0_g2_i2.p1 TRINITY_DN3507_c0_g2~~TRINITY_DN3507_c0_g2_i2.p1  ORF type:complete len:217 (-),score=18.48 TRINITY_DN3507_c0_g2_i2:38-688(-)
MAFEFLLRPLNTTHYDFETPDFIVRGFNKDFMAQKMFAIPGANSKPDNFLWTGLVPKIGQDMYVQLEYIESNGQPKWARMLGRVHRVFAAPDEKPSAKRSAPPAASTTLGALPPSGIPRMSRTRKIRNYGAVHGQRLYATLIPSFDDHNNPQLPRIQGLWDAIFVCNDNLENMWCLESIQKRELHNQNRNKKKMKHIFLFLMIFTILVVLIMSLTK